jgi:hypothetical protein
VLQATKDDHFDGPYVRPETLRQRATGSWAGFNDVIEYRD